MDIDTGKLRRALKRLIDRRNRLHEVFLDQLKRDEAVMDKDELNAIDTALQSLTPDQHHLIERALETGFRFGRPDADRGDFVFVAYARDDAVTAADALYDELSAAGVRCFMDTRDIPPGADWNGSIVEALDQCAALIVLISDAAVGSEYLKSEVQAAFDQKKPVFPVTLNPTLSPERIDNRLRTRMITAAHDASGIKRLVDQLRTLL